MFGRRLEINVTIDHFRFNSNLLSLFFSKFPLNVGSGRRRLKNPSRYRQYVNRASKSKPPSIDIIIIQIGIDPSLG